LLLLRACGTVVTDECGELMADQVADVIDRPLGRWIGGDVGGIERIMALASKDRPQAR
jgi:hypothetical protein